MVSRFAMTMALSALAFGAWAGAPKRGVPFGCDPSVMRMSASGDDAALRAPGLQLKDNNKQEKTK